MVSKLSLATVDYVRPYSLEWLKKRNEVTVSERTFVVFSISQYKNEGMCDVLLWMLIIYFLVGLSITIEMLLIIVNPTQIYLN